MKVDTEFLEKCKKNLNRIYNIRKIRTDLLDIKEIVEKKIRNSDEIEIKLSGHWVFFSSSEINLLDDNAQQKFYDFIDCVTSNVDNEIEKLKEV